MTRSFQQKVHGRRPGLLGATGLIICLSLVTACAADPTEDTATAVLRNNTGALVTVIHCAENCDQTADKGTVQPGATFETNMSSDGAAEIYVIVGASAEDLRCLRATYHGKPADHAYFDISGATPILKKRDCG